MFRYTFLTILLEFLLANYKYLIVLFLLLSVCFMSCKEEDPVTVIQEPGNGKISGTAKFLDETPGPFAAIELKNTTNGSIVSDTCDENGNFAFDSLNAGDYYLTFKSTGPDINTTSVKVTLATDEDVKVQDITITYHQLDDFVALSKTSDIFFLKVQPHGAHIGTRYDKVNYFSGFYRNDWLKKATLTCEVYKIPEGLNWTKSVLTVDSVRASFEFLMEIFEEPMTGNTHEMRIKDAGIPILLSDPPNGFCFIKKYADDKELKIPCMDYINNDFGFTITYK